MNNVTRILNVYKIFELSGLFVYIRGLGKFISAYEAQKEFLGFDLLGVGGGRDQYLRFKKLFLNFINSSNICLP